MIHKFIFNENRIVYDVHSGALHVVDELAWDLLEDYNLLAEHELVDKYSVKYRPEELKETLSEIKGLVEKGLLFSPDPLDGRYTPPKENIIKALCLHLAHDCNLECRYCFAGQGKFGGKPELMSVQVGRKALEFLIKASGPKKHVEVDFFGGEPLLNFKVLQSLVEYGNQLALKNNKVMKFTVTTNAVNLDKRVGQFLNENNISVVLSLDGRPEVHDAMRPFPSGKGSHDIILKKIKDFLKSRDYQDYYIRGTFTSLNLDFAKDVEYYVEQGFDIVSLEPVVSGPDFHYTLQPDMLEEVCAQYETLARMIARMRREGKHINFFHFNVDLDGGPCLPKRLSGCGAGYQYLAVDPQGVLYPCHQFVGQDEFVMGDVYNGVNRWDIGDRFKNTHIYAKEGCSQCWAKFLCSGGCHASAYFNGGGLEKPFKQACVLAKKRYECALYLSLLKYQEA